MAALLLATLPSSAQLTATVTPCARDSLRIRLAPTSPPKEVAATRERHDLDALPTALLPNCGAASPPTPLSLPAEHGNLRLESIGDAFRFSRVDTNATLFTATPRFEYSPAVTCYVGALSKGHDLRVANTTLQEARAWCAANASCVGFTARSNEPCDGAAEATQQVYFKSGATDANSDPAWRRWTKRPAELEGYWAATLELTAGDASEKIFGLGQGGWTASGGCPSGQMKVVPLERNGQSLGLLQRKFEVTIPFAYSSAGYGFLFNMGGWGSVSVGKSGGMVWSADAALELDFWVSALPAAASSATPAPAEGVYSNYADATGHAPMLREDAMLFWQSRNRYRSSAIALDVAKRYAKLQLPVGVLVIDYKNQIHDGDFAPDPSCYPSISDLAAGVRSYLNASTVFSFWPEAKAASAEYGLLEQSGCLINSDLGGYAMDATKASCRDLIWTKFLKPRYFDQGVTSYWLDETDGEGTSQGYTPSGGYNTSLGPRAFASNLWVNQWLATFTEPVRAAGKEPPLVLTRGVWAGGQRHGVVLWSSDIWSTFETLASQVPQGVHASLSGIPWWTTDVGGYGCGRPGDDDSPYMRELIVRWYQFGLFSPIFRTHGCRANGNPEPVAPPCQPSQGSCGANEVWSYGNEVQPILEEYVRIRARLRPYIRALAANVTSRGVPTMRPLWWEFPSDGGSWGVDDQFMLGPDLLVAPVTVQHATARPVYFPAGAAWRSFWDEAVVVQGGTTQTVPAPLATEGIPVYRRVR